MERLDENKQVLLCDSRPDPIEILLKEENRQELYKIMDEVLTLREREIIKLRYGVEGMGSYTLNEVGRIFKVSRERVKQIECKAIRKLQRYYIEGVDPFITVDDPERQEKESG